MTSILDFRSKRVKLFLIYKLPRYFLPNFVSVGISFRRGSAKILFQCGHLGFPIGKILAIFFYLQVLPIFPTRSKVKRPFNSEEAHKRFQDGRHGGYIGFPLRIILAFLN